jgi:hypothetical protein
MIGLLLALGIQGPFASTGKCNNITSDTGPTTPFSGNETSFYSDYTHSPTDLASSTTGQNEAELSFLEKNKYVLIASLLTLIFITGVTLLLVFVKERTGMKKSFLFFNASNLLFLF